jgi:hypothetical protein
VGFLFAIMVCIHGFMLLDDNALNLIAIKSEHYLGFEGEHSFTLIDTNRWKQCRGYINHFWSEFWFFNGLGMSDHYNPSLPFLLS